MVVLVNMLELLYDNFKLVSEPAAAINIRDIAISLTYSSFLTSST